MNSIIFYETSRYAVKSSK